MSLSDKVLAKLTSFTPSSLSVSSFFTLSSSYFGVPNTDEGEFDIRTASIMLASSTPFAFSNVPLIFSAPI